MFIPLYNKSNYTLLSSTLKIDDIISFAKDNKLPAISIVDSNMFSTMEFYNKCLKNNIKPVIGLEILLEDFKIVLFACNYKGYQSLIKLSTINQERVVSVDDLKLYNLDVICVLSYEYIDKYSLIKELYDDYYLGYSSNFELKECIMYSDKVLYFKKALYLEDGDSKLLDYLYRIRDNKTITDEVVYDTDFYSLKMVNGNDVGILNTVDICNKCNLVFEMGNNLIPKFDIEDSSSYLYSLCKVGLSKRLGGEVSDVYLNRLSYELGVILDMGFADYFLIVYDFIKFAKKNKILVGPGRGSAAGSLVSYCLGITDIDPIKYNLLFERFLNPERITMPDIDTDFPDDKRDLVIDYVVKKYGSKRVAGIITFGTLAAKQAIRDVSRVMNIPLYKVDSLTKLVGNSKLVDIYNEDGAFKSKIDSDISLLNMYKIASRLEGFPRHTATHAAGIVMSLVDLDTVVPLVPNNNMYLTGYSMEYLENLGLLKMDFLGIKNLSMINNIIDDVYKYYGKEINFSSIELNDMNVLNMFKMGLTSGIFQFESFGMQQLLKKIQPSNIEDIFAAIALYRPGAAVNIDSYIKRSRGEEEVSYFDPCLESTLSNTYGLFVYQEQIMQTASLYAGFTLGEADILRRAMSKKKLDLLKSQEELFLSKSATFGHSYEDSKKIFDLILKFAGYGFNRSHSVAYSIIAYKMAYLKYYYKEIFYCNLLSNVIGSETKTYEYIQEIKCFGTKILKPSINYSVNKYILFDNNILYPLSNIKSIGGVICKNILAARENGVFLSIYDCFSRLYISNVGKKSIEALIYSGCFLEFGYNIQTLINNIDSLFNYAEITKDIDPSLVAKPEIEVCSEYDGNFLLEKERELFGFYLGNHPANIYRSRLGGNFILCDAVDNYFNKEIFMVVMVDSIKSIKTKKGDDMAFVKGSDETGSMDFTLFPSVYGIVNDLSRGELIKISGKVERRLNQVQVIVNKIMKLEISNVDEN